jgi:transcription elongation factor Elf1
MIPPEVQLHFVQNSNALFPRCKQGQGVITLQEFLRLVKEGKTRMTCPKCGSHKSICHSSFDAESIDDNWTCLECKEKWQVKVA